MASSVVPTDSARGTGRSAFAPTEYIDTWYGRDADWEVAGRVDEVAAKHGMTPAQVALAWVLGRSPRVAPIFGARTTDQVDEAIAALDVHLDAEDEAALTDCYRPRLRALTPEST